MKPSKLNRLLLLLSVSLTILMNVEENTAAPEIPRPRRTSRDILRLFMGLTAMTSCSNFFYRPNHDDTDIFRLLQLSFELYTEVVQVETNYEFPSGERLMASRTKGLNCYLAWIIVDNLREIGRAITKIRHWSVRWDLPTFPDTTEDQFVVQYIGPYYSDASLEAYTHRDRKALGVKYGILIREEGRRLEVFKICRHCNQDSEDDELFVENGVNYSGSDLVFSYPLPLDCRYRLSRTKDGRLEVTSGAYKPLLEMLARRLNFTMVNIIASDDASSGLVFDNGTITGATADVYYGRADITPALKVFRARCTALHYAFPLEYWQLTFTTEKPRKSYSATGIVRPVTLNVYLCMLALTMLLCAVCLFARDIYLRKHNLPSDNWSALLLNILETYEIFYASFLQQPVNVKPNTRLLLALWFLAAMVLSTAYLSKLVDLMTFPSLEWLPNTYSELAYSDYDYKLWAAGGISYRYFADGETDYQKIIFNSMTMEKDVQKCVQYSLEPRKACILYDQQAFYEQKTLFSDALGRTRLRIAKDKTPPLISTFATRKQSLLTESVSRILRPVAEGGIFRLFIEKDMQNERQRYQRLEEKEDHQDYSHEKGDIPFLGDQVGAFYVVVGGWIIALVGRVVEKVAHAYEQAKNRRQKLSPHGAVFVNSPAFTVPYSYQELLRQDLVHGDSNQRIQADHCHHWDERFYTEGEYVKKSRTGVLERQRLTSSSKDYPALALDPRHLVWSRLWWTEFLQIYVRTSGRTAPLPARTVGDLKACHQ